MLLLHQAPGAAATRLPPVQLLLDSLPAMVNTGRTSEDLWQEFGRLVAAAVPRTEDQENQARAALALGPAAHAAKARTGRWANLLQCLECEQAISVAVSVTRNKWGTLDFRYRCPHCDKQRYVGQKRHAALYDLLEAWADNVTNWTLKQSFETRLVLTLQE